MPQTPEQRIAQLEDTVTRLEGMIGAARYMSPRLGFDEWVAAKNAAPLLPSGDRNVADRMREIGVSQDTIVEQLVPDLKARISALEARPVGTETGNPFPAGVQVIEGDVVFKGRVGLGGLNPEARAQLQILNPGAARILFGSNLAGGNWQSAAPHWAEHSLSGDGGIRQLQNAYGTLEERDAYDPDGKVWYKTSQKEFIDPARPVVNVGPDSRGDWSLSKTMPPGAKDENGNLIPEHEYTQDVVLKIYEGQKLLAWESYRRGWQWAFGVDCKYGPPRWWKAIFG